MKTGFILLLCLSLLEGYYCDCRGGWVKNGHTCYHFSHDTENWIDAKLVCQALQGSLVVIESQQENDFLQNQIQSLNHEWYWTALSDMEEEHNWGWMGDRKTALVYYTNWDHGEPSSSDQENCGAIKTNGRWKDIPCHLFGYFICEKPDEMDVIG
ncbi:perlucin-like protein [Mya arenaria]|uniref:perlucin-like protein n=1 Tax=Mya arenaria TaxID=6604 RepID=UPI0022E25A6A|nr:perlucin-like protein [Mya arenaria]